MELALWPKQSLAYETEATEIMYGGSAGSGKSHLIRTMAISMCLACPGLQVYIFRREYDDLRKNHFEGPTSFPAILAEWIALGHVKFNISDMSLTFSNGSKIHACHCQHEKDVYGYKGPEFHVLIVDELTTFTESMYRFLRSRCRMTGIDVPAECPWKFPRILCATNPGDVGHSWVKAAFVDSARPMEVHRVARSDGGMLRQFIPALLKDNPALNEEEYSASLEGIGDPTLVDAMLRGDWNIVAGGMFHDVWNGVVVPSIPGSQIPKGWSIIRAFDWGSSKPFSVGWLAKTDGTEAPGGWCPKAGSWVQIAEWYGWNGKPDTGLKMTAAEIARGILSREKDMGIESRVRPGAADSAMWTHENGHCIADDFARVGVRWEPANKGPGSRVNGWELMRKSMRAAQSKPQEEPGLFIMDNCLQTIRTIPVLPRDKTKSDDVDTKSEDHIGDMLRYAISTKVFGVGTVSGF